MKPQNLYKILSKRARFVTRYFVYKYQKLPIRKIYRFNIDVAKLKKGLEEIYPGPNSGLIHNTDFHAFRTETWKLSDEDIFCQLKEELLLECVNGETAVCHGDSITEQEIKQLQDVILKSKRKKPKLGSKFAMIKKADYGFMLSHFKIKNTGINVNENYNDDLVKITPGIMKFINARNSSGIVLFHGVPGGGKTSYIRSLIASCAAQFIYVPNNLFDHISDPSFVEFMSNFPNSVIILEDCEDLLRARELGQIGNGISNLLNLGDGLLGDALKLKIICTFNCDLGKIDPALLRKGRLVYRYEFGPLAPKKVNRLFEKLEITKNVTEPLTLAEVYNMSHENNGNAFEIKRAIGFAG